jgi:hypothetical protein
LIEQVNQSYSTTLLISFCFFFPSMFYWTQCVLFSFQVLPEVISKHLPKETVPLILRAKVAVDGHYYSSSSSSSQPDVGAGVVAQHHGLSDWPVIWRPTAWTSSICDGWSQFVKDGKLEVGDFCRFRQNALDKNVFQVEVSRPIKL